MYNPINMGSLEGSSSGHDSIYVVCIYDQVSQGCIMQSLNYLLYLENRTRVSGLCML
jgi:hypothetical protein